MTCLLTQTTQLLNQVNEFVFVFRSSVLNLRTREGLIMTLMDQMTNSAGVQLSSLM